MIDWSHSCLWKDKVPWVSSRELNSLTTVDLTQMWQNKIARKGRGISLIMLIHQIFKMDYFFLKGLMLTVYSMLKNYSTVSGWACIVGYSWTRGLWQIATSILPRHRCHSYVLFHRLPRLTGKYPREVDSRGIIFLCVCWQGGFLGALLCTTTAVPSSVSMERGI